MYFENRCDIYKGHIDQMSTSKGCVNANTRSGVKIKKEYILILGLVWKITFN